MPPARRDTPIDAADALIAVAPLASRWIERLLAAHAPPLTLSQYLALRAIAREPLTGSELARRAGVTGSAISQLVGSLAASGWLRREPDPADRRHQTLSLSPAGASVYAAAHELLRGGVGALLADLPPPETDALGRLLPHVEAALAGVPPPRRSPPRGPAPPPRHR